MSYKVLFHIGEAVDLKTKVAIGRLSLEQDQLLIHGVTDITIPFDALRSVELFRLHGIGRMLKVCHTAGTLFISVIRFNLFGLFAVVNFFATGRLKLELEAVIRERATLNTEGAP